MALGDVNCCSCLLEGEHHDHSDNGPISGNECDDKFNVVIFIDLLLYQFPYTDIDKFKRRAHRFILFDLIPTAVTLYLGMILAFSPLLGNLAYFIVGLPFVSSIFFI
jgi:hypothetical protein